MKAIVNYTISMALYMLPAVPVLLVSRYFRIKSLRKRSVSTTIHHEIGLMVFLVFLVGLASQTIIPTIEWGNAVPVMTANGTGRINLIPSTVLFETYHAVVYDRNINYLIINFLGNIVMFMPIGFFLPLLWNAMGGRKILLTGASISLFIETCQIPQARGTDIDDLWINTLGVFLGYMLFRFIQKWTPNFTSKFRVKRIEKEQSPGL